MGKSREVSEKRFPQAGVRRRCESRSGVEKKHHRCEFATEPFPGINKHVINHPKPSRRAGMHARSTGEEARSCSSYRSVGMLCPHGVFISWLTFKNGRVRAEWMVVLFQLRLALLLPVERACMPALRGEGSVWQFIPPTVATRFSCYDS